MTSGNRPADWSEILSEYNASREKIAKGSLCHAPESSLYFGRDGVVSPCCYTRSSPLGRYPEQSIGQIWNGIQVEAMRRSLRKYELPIGCELCAEEFCARNFSGLLARQFDHLARPLPLASGKHAGSSGTFARLKQYFQPKQLKPYPLQMEFELSNSCNLECAMCSGFFSSSIRANREKLPPLPKVYDTAFVEQLKPFIPHLKKVKFLGGEPFLIDIYYKIWDLLIERNPDCTVSITTNGTVYTERVKRVLEKLNCQITVSLDSIVKTTYEAIRINANMEQTLANLEEFCAINQRKNKGLSIAVCPMVSNCREMPELISFANERGISVFFNTVVFPVQNSIKSLTLAEKQELVSLYRREKPAPRNAVESGNYASLEGLSSQIEFWMGGEVVQKPLKSRCAQLLAEHNRTGGRDTLSVVLSDLSGKVNSEGKPVDFESGTPLENLKGYCEGIWEVGATLLSEGLLSDVRFERDRLETLTDYLEKNLNEEQSQLILFKMRQFPRENLRFAGTLSTPKLIEIIDSQLGVTLETV